MRHFQHLVHYVSNKKCLPNLEKQKCNRSCYLERGETICSHSVCNELESDSGKSVVIQ